MSTPLHYDLRTTYGKRRELLYDELGRAGALVVAASPELVSGDVEFRYRPSSDLFYFTGYTEPEAVAVFSPALEPTPFTLFVRSRDPVSEQWTGVRGGTDAAKDSFDADVARPLSQLASMLPALLADVDTIYYALGAGRTEVDELVLKALSRGRKRWLRHGRGPHVVVHPDRIMAELRSVKDLHEIAMHRRAADITVEGFQQAALHIRHGAMEWEVEAALEYTFRSRGGDGPAFPTIVASGPGATVLHYVSNDRRMNGGELVVVDAGASYNRYAADITRTFPVTGKFLPEQRDLYNMVLGAQRAAIAMVRPGTGMLDVHRTALRFLLQGMLDLDLIDGELEDLVAAHMRKERESGARRPRGFPEPESPGDGTMPAAAERSLEGSRLYYPHGTSHWLGLDVHDPGRYTRLSDDGEDEPVQRLFEPGMVLTVEPGIYIQPGDEDAPAELQGTGIRIEDDVLVTARGSEILTRDLPVAPDDVEQLVG